LAFSLLEFESLVSTLSAASSQRVTGKESHFFSVFCVGTAWGTQVSKKKLISATHCTSPLRGLSGKG
jgi:hypothetical protein